MILFALVTPAVSVWAIFQGKFKPQRMTRLLILILSIITFASLIVQWSSVALYLSAIQLFWCILYFILSLRRGMGGMSRLDIFIFLCTVAIGCIWYTTGDSFLAMVLSVCTNFVAYIPTIVKTYHHPYTEIIPFYAFDVVAAILNFILIWSPFVIAATYTWYVFLINIIMLVLILSWRSVVKK